MPVGPALSVPPQGSPHCHGIEVREKHGGSVSRGHDAGQVSAGLPFQIGRNLAILALPLKTLSSHVHILYVCSPVRLLVFFGPRVVRGGFVACFACST